MTLIIRNNNIARVIMIIIVTADLMINPVVEEVLWDAGKMMKIFPKRIDFTDLVREKKIKVELM